MTHNVEVLESFPDPRARALLGLLVAAEAPLAEGELVQAAGVPNAAIVDAMIHSGILERDCGRLRLAEAARDQARKLAGDPSPQDWRLLAHVAERTHAAWPLDPDLLLLRCRVLCRSSRVPEAIDLLTRCRQARHAMAASRLAWLTRAMAAAEPASARRGFLLLARELLRRGEVELARSTLDEAEAAEGNDTDCEIHVLRAETHARAARPVIAAEVYKCAQLSGSGAGQLLLTELAIQRGKLAEARSELLAMAAITRGRPELEARRWVDAALSLVCESRFHLAKAALRRARSALGLRPAGALGPSLRSLEVLVRIHLDELDVAAAMLAGTNASPDEQMGALLRAALLGRQGDLQACVDVGSEGASRLEARGDRFLLTVLQRYLGHAAMGLGQLERAEQHFRAVAGIARESDIAVFAGLCERDFALLAEARGDFDEARKRALRASSLSPKDPYARIEAWVLADAPRPHIEGFHPAIAAYALLRSAERCVRHGALEEAITASQSAINWYRTMGARHELARALVTRAEALSRLQRFDKACGDLDACDQLARAHALHPIVVACALLRASIADRTGDLDSYAHALTTANHHAKAHIPGHAVAAACFRLGLSESRPAPGAAPFSRMIERLGLARPAVWVTTCGDRTWLTSKRGKPGDGFDLELDLELTIVHAGSQHWDLTGQPLLFRLLDALVSAGAEGVSIEALFARVWGGEYHPLRHRNTVYGAIARLRRGLEPLMASHPWLMQDEGRYRVRNLRVARVAMLSADEAPCSSPGLPNGLVRRRSSPSWPGE